MTDKVPFAEAILKLKQLISEATKTPSSTRDSICMRFEVSLTETDPLAWLAAQTSDAKTYFRSRPNGRVHLESAGLGVADRILVDTAPLVFDKINETIQNRLRNSPANCRYYGGCQFHAIKNHADGSIRDQLGAASFVLPRFELLKKNDDTVLGCNLLSDELYDQNRLDEILSRLEGLVPPVELTPEETPTVIGREDLPDKKGWCERVERCVGAIDEYELDKIVLARKSTFSFTRPLNPWILLNGFREKDLPRFLFGFQPEDGPAFISSTPELLYYRNQDRLTSEALAGTRPRSENTDEDTRLSEQLMRSKKERREHAFVANQVADHLGQLCDGPVDQTALDLARLEHVQHLVARFEGKLKKDITDADLLAMLHPTPAVGGHPREQAMELIRTLETFDRGWYAGPIGWMAERESLFAVGIRSGLVYKHRLTLYSGAGIVEGSLPIREWAEIENKIQGFLSLLTRS